MRRRSNTAHKRREAELPSGELSEVSNGMRAGSAGSLKIPTLALLINTVLALPNPEDESNIHNLVADPQVASVVSADCWNGYTGSLDFD